MNEISAAAIDEFIRRWAASGAAERANYQRPGGGAIPGMDRTISGLADWRWSIPGIGPGEAVVGAN